VHFDAFWRQAVIHHFNHMGLQEAQLPQRNSASAVHIGGGGARPSSPLPLRPLWLHQRIRNPQQTYVKRAVH